MINVEMKLTINMLINKKVKINSSKEKEMIMMVISRANIIEFDKVVEIKKCNIMNLKNINNMKIKKTN
jgi:hypothetical protein